MRVTLDMPPLYLAEVRRIAKETSTTTSSVVSGIVKLYLDSSVKEARTWKRPDRYRAIKDQHGNRYASIQEAAAKLGLHTRLISYVLSGGRESTGGYRFKYVDG